MRIIIYPIINIILLILIVLYGTFQVIWYGYLYKGKYSIKWENFAKLKLKELFTTIIL